MVESRDSGGRNHWIMRVVVGGLCWFHTLGRGGCQSPCPRVFPLVTALPAIGLRGSWIIARG